MSCERVGSIIHEDLYMRNLFAKWVSKFLNADQRRQVCQCLSNIRNFLCRIHLWFRWMGVLQVKSMTSQRNRAVTRWRIFVTMVTLCQQQDGGYILLWKRYVNNKMAAMRFLHLQQYSHRLNLLYVFFDAIQTISCSDGWPWTKPGNMVMTRRQGNNQWNGGISAHPSPYNSECKNLLENMSPRHFGIKKAASSLLIFQKGQSINAKYYTSLLVQFKNILKGKTRKISSSGLVLAR